MQVLLRCALIALCLTGTARAEDWELDARAQWTLGFAGPGPASHGLAISFASASPELPELRPQLAEWAILGPRASFRVVGHPLWEPVHRRTSAEANPQEPEPGSHAWIWWTTGALATAAVLSASGGGGGDDDGCDTCGSSSADQRRAPNSIVGSGPYGLVCVDNDCVVCRNGDVASNCAGFTGVPRGGLMSRAEDVDPPRGGMGDLYLER